MDGELTQIETQMASGNTNRATSVADFEKLESSIKKLITKSTGKIESYTQQISKINNTNSLNTILAEYKGRLKVLLARYTLGGIRAEFQKLIATNISGMNSNNQIKSMIEQHKDMTGLHDKALALQNILKEKLGNDTINNSSVTINLIKEIVKEGENFITQTQKNFTDKTGILQTSIAQNIQTKTANRNSAKEAILTQIEQVKVAITQYLDNLRTSIQKHKELTNYLQQANQQSIKAVLGNNYATKLNAINISKYQTTFKEALNGINKALQNHVNVNDESLPISS